MKNLKKTSLAGMLVLLAFCFGMSQAKNITGKCVSDDNKIIMKWCYPESKEYLYTSLGQPEIADFLEDGNLKSAHLDKKEGFYLLYNLELKDEYKWTLRTWSGPSYKNKVFKTQCSRTPELDDSVKDCKEFLSKVPEQKQ
ncbi:MAG: hypothetical protein K0R14_515 [Burkholderiales bacterium]|jgi:hypothetical protein|nr:hypothetical protein [Burkholderiales bacterium]